MLPTATGKRRISSAPMPASNLGAELAIARAAEPELETVLVAAEPEHVQAAELELAPEAVEPVRGHPRARLAVALRTKSVTAAHRRDLPLLAAEDLVAGAAETTREPAAA